MIEPLSRLSILLSVARLFWLWICMWIDIYNTLLYALPIMPHIRLYPSISKIDLAVIFIVVLEIQQ